MAQVTYTIENDECYADFDNRKKTRWLERFIPDSEYPEMSVEKGDVIYIDFLGNGTTYPCRVLKVEDQIAEICVHVITRNVQFSATIDSKIYANASLDTELNTRWYGTLSQSIKDAIVDKTFRQDQYKVGNSTQITSDFYYLPSSYSPYNRLKLVSSTFGSTITRHVYTFSVTQIIEYLGATKEMTAQNTTLTDANIKDMVILPGLESVKSSQQIWTTSACDGEYTTYSVFSIFGTGQINDICNSGAYNIAIPVLQIDLSKITYTKEA